MKDKMLKIVTIVGLLVLFVAVIVTSILINEKRKDKDNLPDIDNSAIIELVVND